MPSLWAYPHLRSFFVVDSKAAQSANSNSSTNARQTRPPPRSALEIVRSLGPGLIIAGSIVGSGELIATTKAGAEAGIWLLWLILLGCLIKVFTQVELGRYTITSGKTAMEALNEVPGPRWKTNWVVWYWLFMFLASLGQLGGIVGGVGQALAIAQPITSQGVEWNRSQDLQIRLQVEEALLARLESDSQVDPGRIEGQRRQVSRLEAETREAGSTPSAYDDLIWAALITLITSIVLVWGRYNLIQALSTALVATFTLVTVGNLIHLQTLPDWRISWSELADGMSFRLPPAEGLGGRTPLATALAAFGIIGVGATELIQYPYWCLEKGYARWTGPRETTRAWAERARGWLRVLQWDAWCSAAIYTFATLAFYLLGAAVLGSSGLNPAGGQMIRTLAEMYAPVFGVAAQAVFLFGALAVLYSTFFVATAGHARVCADALRVFGIAGRSEGTRRFWVRFFSGLFPIICFLVYAYVRAPVKLVLLSGVMQAIMLPMLAASALYFRHRRIDPRLAPGRVWDICLWLSSLGLLAAGGWLAITKLFPGLET